MLPSCKPVIGVTQAAKKNKKRQKNLEKGEAGCTKPCATAAATVPPPHAPRPGAHSHTLLCHTQGRDEQVSSAYWSDGKLFCPKTPRLAGPGKAKGLHLQHGGAGGQCRPLAVGFMVSWLKRGKLSARPGGSQERYLQTITQTWVGEAIAAVESGSSWTSGGACNSRAGKALPHDSCISLSAFNNTVPEPCTQPGCNPRALGTHRQDPPDFSDGHKAGIGAAAPGTSSEQAGTHL